MPTLRLKNCAHCGAPAVFAQPSMLATMCYVQCTKCGTRSGAYDTDRQAHDAWNMRVRRG